MKHHYIPQFLQKYWLVNNDDLKIFIHSLEKPMIPVSKRSPKYTGYEDDLFALDAQEVHGMDKQANETELFQLIDNNGALAIEKIIKNGLDSLDETQKNKLIIFIISLIYRQPESINLLKQISRQVIKEQLERDKEEYKEIGDENYPSTLKEFVELNFPNLIENFGLRHLNEIMFNPKTIYTLREMKWFELSFRDNQNELLLSDNPVVQINSIDDDSFIIGLPISPNRIIFAVKNDQIKLKLKRSNKGLLIKRINESSLNQAKSRVYSSREYPTRNFIKNHIRKIKGFKLDKSSDK